jgi:mRNA-degrading endonuclease RelE of RelBE toxin-antitoxin system
MEVRVSIQWTHTAKESLKTLPKRVIAGLLGKADELAASGVDPRKTCKALTGPLRGFYRLAFGRRYRAVFQVKEEKSASGDLILSLTVLFVVAGIRRDFDKQDIYNVARKLIEAGLADGNESESEG